jgi:hypothetical protein
VRGRVKVLVTPTLRRKAAVHHMAIEVFVRTRTATIGRIARSCYEMRFLLTLATAGLLLAPAAAPARGFPADADVRDSPDLWATINVCDTAAYPNTIGIRGSMPGLGRRRATLWMRFQVQYLRQADGKWHNIDAGADSSWKRLGGAGKRVIESGQNFMFKPPAESGTHVLRGAVTFKWVVRGRAVRKLREITEAGHHSTAGADPPDYSAATCQIT